MTLALSRLPMLACQTFCVFKVISDRLLLSHKLAYAYLKPQIASLFVICFRNNIQISSRVIKKKTKDVLERTAMQVIFSP